MGGNHLKNYFIWALTALLLLTLLHPTSLTQSEPPTTTLSYNTTITFSPTTIHQQHPYTTITQPASIYLNQPDQPQIPQKTLIYTLPYKSNLMSLNINFSPPIIHHLTTPLLLSPQPLSLDTTLQTTTINTKTTQLYHTYPPTNYTYFLKYGIDPTTNSHITYLIIHLYPIHYQPTTQTITISNSATIQYTYIPSPLPKPRNQEYLHLIITSPLLEPQANRLSTFKNHIGIPTTTINTTTINTTYPGTDLQEQIRNTITSYVTTNNITYVTLLGDADQIPVRLAYISTEDNPYIATDLYYADLDGTWDDNNDGLYADPRYDTIDGIPDVHIGRIPASLPYSAEDAIDKIITYFTALNTNELWTQTTILASGVAKSGRSDFGTGFTHLNNFIANITTTPSTIKLFEPQGTLNLTTLLTNLDNGSLFLNLVGHGSFNTWLLRWIINYTWSEDLTIPHVQNLNNTNKTPLITTMSCSTARFDDQDCIGEHFILTPTVGAIAFMGSTRTAYGYINNDITTGLMGELNWRIYDTYHQNITQIGKLWSIPITTYIQNHSLLNSDDRLTVLEFILLGDPTINLAPQPKTVYIDDDYTPTTPGWGYTHFKTIQHGINVIAPNGTIYINNGTYEEHLTISTPLTLLGTHHHTTTIIGNGTGTGITISTNNVTIQHLTIRNYTTAILLTNSIHTTINNTDITFNTNTLHLINATNNTISYNNITINGQGIILTTSNNNTIHHNNFAYNTQDAIDQGNNFWYITNPPKGNYWNNYTGSDTNQDGIGDTPQPIPGGINNDLFPLYHPYHTNTSSHLTITPSYLTIPKYTHIPYILTIDTLPEGLSELTLTLTITNPLIATIINISQPPWIKTFVSTPLPSPTLSITLTDSNNSIQAPATNITLATLIINTTQAGTTWINQTLDYILDDTSHTAFIKPQTSFLTSITIPPLPTQIYPPTDPDGDGILEDLNGDTLLTLSDIQLFFTYFEWIETHFPLSLTDTNHNSHLDYDDIITLYQEI